MMTLDKAIAIYNSSSFAEAKNTLTMSLKKSNWFEDFPCGADTDYDEPFGAILWHRRTGLNFPLCGVAHICEMEMIDLIKMEMGWAMPENTQKFEQVMLKFWLLYGMTPEEYFQLRQKGLQYMKESPMDLSMYLGIHDNGSFKELKPKLIYVEKKKPSFFERMYVMVSTYQSVHGLDLPEEIVWDDGRKFHIDQIDNAQQFAQFKTGGIGTRFSCWFKGQQRCLGFEVPGKWFVEAPRYA